MKTCINNTECQVLYFFFTDQQTGLVHAAEMSAEDLPSKVVKVGIEV
jgi:hypothetical protein